MLHFLSSLASAAALIVGVSSSNANRGGPTPLAASLLGVNVHPGAAPLAAQVAMLHKGGFTWIRNDVIWQTIEPTTRGAYDYASTDDYFHAIQERNMSKRLCGAHTQTHRTHTHRTAPRADSTHSLAPFPHTFPTPQA